jgi:hypothetical protein
MPTFAMKGNTAKLFYGAYSRTKLVISGTWHMSGPQPVGDGGVPQWVADLMESRPDIQQVAVSTKTGGAIWSRMDDDA